MSGISARYSIDDLEAKKALDGIEHRLARSEKPLMECGLVLLRSIAKTFEAGGRPVRWKPSVRAKTTGGKTLIKTARLMRSITMTVLGRILTVGTNVKYARIHHLGGEIRKNVTVKKHRRFITQAFGKPIEGRRILVRSHQRQMDIDMPKRPYLIIQDADYRVFNRIVADYTTSS